MRIEDVSAVILAGGYSSRMGRNKAELTLYGETFPALTVSKLKKLGITDIMLSGWEADLPGTRFIPDIIPHRGPLSGIHACLRAAEHEACLVLAVDTPLVPLELLRALIDAHRGGITVTEHGNRLEPLIAVYRRELAREAEDILNSESYRLMKLFDRAEVTRVPYGGDARLLHNCNTPEDLRILLRVAEETRREH